MEVESERCKLKAKLDLLEKALKQLGIMYDGSKIILNPDAYDKLLFIKNIVQFEDKLLFINSISKKNLCSLFIQYRFDDVLLNTLWFLKSVSEKFDARFFSFDETKRGQNLDINGRSLSVFVFIMQILYNITELGLLQTTQEDQVDHENKNERGNQTQESVSSFVDLLYEKKAIDALLTFFENDTLLKKSVGSGVIHDIIISILKILNNFTHFKLSSKSEKSPKWMNQRKIIEFVLKKFYKNSFNFKLDNAEIKHQMNEIVLNIRFKRCIDKKINIDVRELIESDDMVYVELFYFYRLVQRPNFVKYDLIINEGYLRIIEKIFNYYLKMILTSTDLDFDRFTLDNPLEETNLDFFRVRIPSCLSSRRLSIMYFLVTIINYNVVYILKYKRKFNESPIKKYLKVFLSIYLRIITYKSFMLNLYLVRNDLLTKFLFFINSIKFMSIIDKLSWLELNVYENLHRISTILRKINKSSSNKDTILCYWILAHIGSEKQLEGEESIMNFLIESIFENFKDYVENNPNNREFEVSYFNQKLTIKNLVDCLRRLCLIKRLKEFVYFDQEFFLIKSIFFNSLTDVETKISILKLYIQLGLNNIKVFQHLASDNELKDFVVKLSLILNKNIDAELAKACQALLWLLNEKDKNISLKSNINLSLIEQSTSSENIKNELKIILIYDSLTNQGFAVVLEDSLNQSNFHISRIYEKNDSKTNSYLERIKSIEKCNVVLICLSEGFRLNEYCQLEATYACEMNKALIVLSLDGCFSSNGEYFDFEGSWLERVLTQKIRVDFVQNSFNLGIKILIEKLNSIKRNRSNEIHNLPIQ